MTRSLCPRSDSSWQYDRAGRSRRRRAGHHPTVDAVGADSHRPTRGRAGRLGGVADAERNADAKGATFLMLHALVGPLAIFFLSLVMIGLGFAARLPWRMTGVAAAFVPSASILPG